VNHGASNVPPKLFPETARTDLKSGRTTAAKGRKPKLVSIGTQKGPRIGVQKGPLSERRCGLVQVANRRDPRTWRATTTAGTRPSTAAPPATPVTWSASRIRKRIEEAFGWAKTVAGLRNARHRGVPKIDWQFTFAMAAYNLVRLPKLLGAAA
jgi:hypothetical protein